MSGPTSTRSPSSATVKYGLTRALLLAAAIAAAGGSQDVRAEAESAPDASTGAVGLEEVVVTARKRAENLQETPVSVTAISGSEVQQLNLRNFQDLRGLVPNLEVLPLATGGASMTIRGIGQTSSQVNVDAKAGFYVDDMYVARQEGNQLYFYDVDSLQVLKGPQGTLFGKNTTAGAVLLATARPSADGASYLTARAGNYNRLDTEGAINIPLTDILLTRVSFKTDNADGFVKHVLDGATSNGTNDKSARLQVRATPSQKLTIDLLGEYNQSNTDGLTTIMTACNPSAAYIKDYNALHAIPYCSAYPVLQGEQVYGGATLSIPTSSLITDVAQGGDASSANGTRGGHRGPFNDTAVRTINLRMNYALSEDLLLKSTTAFRRSTSQWYNPTVNAPNDIYAELDTTATNEVTQEFNVNGRAINNRLNYVAGLYYFSQKTGFVQDTGPDWIDPIGYTYAGNNDFKSWAGYAQISFKLLNQLELTLGGRYTHDSKTADSNVYLQTIYTAPACNTFANAFKSGGSVCGGNYVGSGSKSWHSFDPRGEISYQWTRYLMSYVSVTSGYNAGGFNQQLGANLGGILVPYQPERLMAYELGTKSEWFDRRLRFNVAGFYQDYSDIQTTLLIEINGVATRQVQTGASAHEQGFEAELMVAPTQDLLFRANGSYLDQAYDSIAKGVTSITLQTPVNSAPKYTYSIDGQYTLHLMSSSTLTPSFNWRAVGRKPYCTPVGSCYAPGYGLLGGRLDFRPRPDSPWTVGLWGTNLLNAEVQLSRGGGTAMGISSFTPGRPREFGVDVRRNFQ
jgi:iron complex outermembrane receptor protein